MRTVARTAGTLLLTGILAMGCAEPDDGLDEEGEGAPPAQPPAADQAQRPATPEARPDTTAESLWAHLQNANYREAWRRWPGTEPLYQGSEPHGMLLTTYINDVARQALGNGGAEDLPPGSIIVKENYMPDSTFDAATVMYKVEGYDPEHDDWLWAKFDAHGGADEFGHPPMCQECHRQAGTGYVFTEVPR